MRDVIFYHMYCVNDCLERFDRTYNKLVKSCLLDEVGVVHLIMVGKDRFKFKEEIEKKMYVNILISAFEEDCSETRTLELIWSVCATHHYDDFNILYLHSKGVTRGQNDNISDWIDYMEYFCIDKWKDCIEALDTHDTCGVNLQEEPMKHYSGNFWWTNSNYIRRRGIINPEESTKIKDPRWYCEFWLLDMPDVKPYSLHNSEIDHYANRYEKEKYIK